MAALLNKVKNLNNEQLIKTIKENGYEDIAKLLENRDVDGQKLLELSEFQTISWRLPPKQLRSLFSFIKQLKENPSIIIKPGPIRHVSLSMKKPTPLSTKPTINLPNSNPNVSKPNVSLSKPSINIPKPTQNLPKPPLSSKSDFNSIKRTLATKQSVLPPKPINKTTDNDIDCERTLKVSTKVSPRSSPTRNINEIRSDESTQKPPPPFVKQRLSTHNVYNRQNTNIEESSTNPVPLDAKKPKSLPDENIQTKLRNVSNKQQPDKPIRKAKIDIPFTKGKVIQPIPNKPKFTPVTAERNKNASLHPVTKQTLARHQNYSCSEGEEDYEDINDFNHPDEDYLTPNDLDTNTSSSNTADISIPKRLNIGSPVRNRSPLQLNSKIELNKKSPVADRLPIPLPIQHSSSLNALDIKAEDVDDINDYECIPHEREREIGRNLKTINGYLDLQVSTSTPQTKKCTLSDLENIIIINEDQQKSSNNFFGTISKFFWKQQKVADDSKEFIKPEDSKITSNYENHMLQNEIPSHHINTESIKKRPLPEIPIDDETENKSDTFYKYNSKDVPSTKSKVNTQRRNSVPESGLDLPKSELGTGPSNRTLLKPTPISPTPLPIQNELTSRFQKRNFAKLDTPPQNNSDVETDTKFYKDSNKIHHIDSSREVSKSPYFEIQTPPTEGDDEFDDDQPLYGNINENGSIHSLEDLPEYENSNSLKITINKNSVTQNQLFHDDLASKLAAALIARDSKLKESPKTLQTEENLNETAVHNTQQKFLLPSPARSIYSQQSDDDECKSANDNEEPVYGNLDQEEYELDHHDEPNEQDNSVDSIFNINQEPFFRNTDRKGAKRILRPLPNGAFLFRPSEKYFLVLTLKNKDRYYNLGIERTTNNKLKLNCDHSSVSPEFGTLREFVKYFTNEAVSFRDQDEFLEIYLNPALINQIS